MQLNVSIKHHQNPTERNVPERETDVIGEAGEDVILLVRLQPPHDIVDVVMLRCTCQLNASLECGHVSAEVDGIELGLSGEEQPES